MIAQKVRESLALRPSTEQQREKDEKSTVLVFVWTLFFFKMVTLVATLWVAAGSLDAAVVLIATNWIWLFVPVIMFSGPALYHLRLRRVRRRRAAMVRAEWMLE
jgi:hypothetical protein